MNAILLSFIILSLIIWIGLLGFRGRFWLADQRLLERDVEWGSSDFVYPSVGVIIPARNEAALLPQTLRSLLIQAYPGDYFIVLVDDQSTDGTANVAQEIARNLGQENRLTVILSQPLPADWTGKRWAMQQGVQFVEGQNFNPKYLLFTDADIQHSTVNLRQFVQKAERENLDLLSLMVKLRCESFWEQLLIPAFVFFFQKLYPFRWVNHPKTAIAAAGGCILIRQAVLKRIGGLPILRQALIDNCTLAQAVKLNQSSFQSLLNLRLIFPFTQNNYARIWLGLSDSTSSLRPYFTLQQIWQMVARTAFSQLNYSPLMLAIAILGMSLTYLIPPLALIIGIINSHTLIIILSILVWILMTIAYLPTILYYQCFPLFAVCLPGIALLYTLMTIDSALKYWQGQGGAWKGRIYSNID